MYFRVSKEPPFFFFWSAKIFVFLQAWIHSCNCSPFSFTLIEIVCCYFNFWVKFCLKKKFWSFSAWILVFPLTFIVESLHSWDALKHVSFIARWEVAAWELQEGERSLPNVRFLIDAKIAVRDTTLKNVVTNQMCWKVWTFVRRFFSLRRKIYWLQISSKFWRKFFHSQEK